MSLADAIAKEGGAASIVKGMLLDLEVPAYLSNVGVTALESELSSTDGLTKW